MSKQFDCAGSPSGEILLQRVSPVCQRIEVANLITEALYFKNELVRLGPERMSELPGDLIPKMRLAPKDLKYAGGFLTKPCFAINLFLLMA